MSSVSPTGPLVHSVLPSSKSPSPTLSQIEAVIASHYRLTGRQIDWKDAVRRLDRFNLLCVQDDFPFKTRDVVIGCYLISETYDPRAINAILAHVAIFKTAIGAPNLDEVDAEAVDELLQACRHWTLGA